MYLKLTNDSHKEYHGFSFELSTPIAEVEVNDIFYTMDTQRKYVWDGTKWVLKPISGVFENIPMPPSTDGTYTLQATVNDGVATYSWV